MSLQGYIAEEYLSVNMLKKIKEKLVKVRSSDIYHIEDLKSLAISLVNMMDCPSDRVHEQLNDIIQFGKM